MSSKRVLFLIFSALMRALGSFAYRCWKVSFVVWVVCMAVVSVYNAVNPWSGFNRGLVYDPGAEVLLRVGREIEVSFALSVYCFLKEKRRANER